MTHYRVIVRNPNSWLAATSEHEMLIDCGHRHRSIEAASRCRDKLVDFNFRRARALAHRTSSSGSWSAAWHNARVEVFDGPDAIGEPVATD